MPLPKKGPNEKCSPYRSAIHMRRNFADHLRRNCSPAFLPITWDEMSVKPYELPANYVQSSTYNETMSHLTMQLSFILQWFYLLGGWGGGWGGFRVHIMCQCHKCHACHTKRRSMSPNATPATQLGRRCHQVDVDVTKCSTWRLGMSPGATPDSNNGSTF